MRVEGAIRPAGRQAGFDREAWCRLVRDRPEFRRPSPRVARNPFDGALITLRTTPDVAEVLLDSRVVGEVYWSMSEEPLVVVSVEPAAIPLVHEWAAALGGEFRSDPAGT
jgi:hypothetical protein